MIRVEKRGPVTTVLIDRPDVRNAVDRDTAQALAAELGVASWSPAHDSTPFRLNAGRMWTYVLNKAAFWRHERWSVDVQDGSDDIALALAVDAWSRTGRVSVEAASAVSRSFSS